jgi:VWFA-related protein
MSARTKPLLDLVLCGLAFIPCTHVVAQQAKDSQAAPFKIEVKVNKVLVPVVVRDAERRAVGNLKKEDFQVFDQDQLQIVSGFSIEKRGLGETDTRSGTSSPANPNTAPPSSSAPQRFIVLLFDDLHLAADQLGQIQRLGTKILALPPGGSDMAAVVSTSGTNSGLTNDRAKLQQAIRNLKSQPLYQRQDRQCPNIDYYEADRIENKRDGTALEAAVQQTLACANLDPQTMRNVAETMVRSTASSARVTGDQDVRVTLATIREFVRKMGTLPGQRTLILVSPGFLTLTQEALTWKTQILDLAAQSSVTISALDARGLYTTELGASERGPDSKMAFETDYESQSHRTSVALNEDVMAELADGSGGTYFHDSNDLEAGFKDLAAAPEYVYILELSLGGVKPDGTYHRLKVKVDRDGLQLQARRGYFAPKPGKDAKELGKEPQKDKSEISGGVLMSDPAVPAQTPAAGTKGPDSQLINRSLNWAPPQIDEPLRDHVSSLPCVLSDILERAGARANELYDSLESFSAQERIEYQASDHMGYLQDARTGTFDYVVLFEQTAGGTTVQESRKPKHGSHLLAVFSQDVGLPEMALMFLPEIQDNYEMSCEGTGEWNRQRTQVVHFVQRKDKPNHTLSFRDSDGAAHPARLKGRAWIAADSGEVLHMETSLMEEIPAAKVRHWYLSVDYAPVRFHSQNVRMLLPQAVDAYYDFEDHRTIAYHTFTDFMLFSVQTDQAIQKPKNP